MPRFEIYTVIALFCLVISIGFINNNNPVFAAGLSLISLLPATLLRNELENARWEITIWNKLLPMGSTVFMFLIFVYFVMTNFAILVGNVNLPTAINILIFVVDAGISLFIVYVFIFSKPVNG